MTRSLGMDPEEIRAAGRHATVYAGAPAGHATLAVAACAQEELGVEP